jgi:nucleoside-diphosphate-sugar epimerase
MRRILVTGAGGYIGTALVPLLLKAGYHVRAVDRFFFGRDLLPVDERLEVIREDARHLEQSHFGGIHAVIDLVAISNDPSGEAFQDATWAINMEARVRTARLARASHVKRYVLPSSCSIYGFLPADAIADENTATNPLTTYAKANEKAEQGVLPLAAEDFCVVVLRQATVYGYAPRMRFDLAINGMTFGAWKTGRLPLMRDGSQWRPMVHVKRHRARADLHARGRPGRGERPHLQRRLGAQCLSDRPTRRARSAKHVPRPVEIEWYGDPDHRSYRVSFDRVEALGYRAEMGAEDGVAEICAALDKGLIDKTPKTITLEWYKALENWHRVVREVELHGGILDI